MALRILTSATTWHSMFMTQDGRAQEVPFQRAMIYSHAKGRKKGKLVDLLSRHGSNSLLAGSLHVLTSRLHFLFHGLASGFHLLTPGLHGISFHFRLVLQFLLLGLHLVFVCLRLVLHFLFLRLHGILLSLHISLHGFLLGLDVGLHLVQLALHRIIGQSERTTSYQAKYGKRDEYHSLHVTPPVIRLRINNGTASSWLA